MNDTYEAFKACLSNTGSELHADVAWQLLTDAGWTLTPPAAVEDEPAPKRKKG